MTSTAFSAEDPALGWLVTILRPFMKSPKRGAETPIYLASAPEAESLTGKFFADRKAKKSNDSSYDAAITGRLWQVSAGLVGVAPSVS
jgi:hypothetical protein